MSFTIETEREEDGRWIAEVLEIPGVLAYGDSEQEAISKAQALGLRVIADQVDNEEIGPRMLARIAKSTGLKQDDLSRPTGSGWSRARPLSSRSGEENNDE